MNVLSLFDGMSCGQLALQKLGITNINYFASEIDKYAIQVTQHNFPATTQLGDVTKVSSTYLPKIDLLIGGSPCQGFSFAGKQLNFSDPRSALFFEFVRLLKETKPRYFLLENVKMKKEYQDIITAYLGVEPIEINSALMSAQNRVRLYWTNIPNVTQPNDLGILLEDIIENGEVDREKSLCVTSRVSGATEKRYKEKAMHQMVMQRPCTPIEGIGRDSVCKQIAVANDINGHDIFKRVYATSGKAPTLNSMGGGNREPKIATSSITYRKLTPLECERLQTVPDGYTLITDTNGKQLVSNSQRYRMLGNGWTINVIAHILSNMEL